MTKTAPEKEISTDHLTIKIKHLPSCKVELAVHALPEFVKISQKKATKEVSKQVSIPGFRKGKAPLEIILKKYSGAVEEKLHSILADDVFKEAQKKVDLRVLSNGPKISYDIKTLTLEEGADLIFKFEIEPDVPSIDATKFTLKDLKQREIGKKEVEEAIRQTQFFYAKWEEIKDRAVQEGDHILLDIETLEEPKQKVFQGTRFEVKSDHMAQWMKDLVIGMKLGESKEGISKPDASAGDKEKEEFQPKKVSVTIKKIEKPQLPTLDEEFAKKVGAKSIEEFKSSLEKMLKKRASEEVEMQKREAVNQFLIKNHPFELPHSLIQKELDFRFQQMMENPRAKKEYEQFSQEEKNNQMKNLSKQSHEAVRLFYLSRKIVHDAKIDVTYDDVLKEAVATLQSYGPMKIDPKTIPQEVYALAFSKVMLRKAQDFILEENRLEKNF